MALRVILWVAVFGLAAVSWRSAEKYLTAYAADLARGRGTGQSVYLVNAPDWMSGALKEGLCAEAAAPIGADPFASGDLEASASRIATSPWVKQVQSVQRLADGHVAVCAAYREPVAVVESPSGGYLVDRDGVRLPGRYARADLGRLGLPVIEGVALSPPGMGRRWPGGDLHAGLSLLSLLGGEPYSGQILAVDVSHRDARGRVDLVIRTEHGAVRWGLAPGREAQVEPAAATKKLRLAGVYERFGTIDAGGQSVELQGAAVYVRHAPAPGREGGFEYAAAR